MFEGMVAGYINQYLGDYIDQVDSNKLSIGVLSGDVNLGPLALKADALNALELPMTVIRGSIGRLVIKARWTALASAPVVAELHDLFVLCGPKAAVPYDAKAEAEKELAAKKSALATLEAAKESAAAAAAAAPPTESADTFTSRLTAKVVDNLQVRLINIHIRYEDAVTVPGSVLAVGLTLGSLSAVSTDANWIEAFLADSSAALVHKLIELKGVSVYMSPSLPGLFPAATATDPQFRAFMMQNIEAATGVVAAPPPVVDSAFVRAPVAVAPPPRVEYLICPISGFARVIVNKRVAEHQLPEYDVHVRLQTVGFALSEAQYREIGAVGDSFAFYNKSYKYRRFHPPVRPRGGKAWWAFARACIISDVQERHAQWRPAFFAAHRRARKDYVRLYKRLKLEPKKMTPAETEALSNLDTALPFEDIKYFRSLAELEIKDWLARNPPKPQSKGWFGGWFGGSKEAEPAPGTPSAADEASAEDQRRYLYEAISYVPGQVEAKDPPDYVRVRLAFGLETAAVALSDSRGDALVALEVTAISALVQQRPGSGSMRADVSVGALTVTDRYCTDSVYPRIVSTRPVSSAVAASAPSSLLTIAFESKPLDGRADVVADITAASLEVVYNPRVVDRVALFFASAGAGAVASVDLSRAYTYQVENLKLAASTNVAWAIQNQSTAIVNARFEAPRILVPRDCAAADSSVLVVDLGVLTLRSRERAKRAAEVVSLAAVAEEDVYDTFDVRLADCLVAVLQGGAREVPRELVAAVTDGSLTTVDLLTSPFLLDPFSISLEVASSRLPDSPLYTKLKVAGALPSLRLAISTRKIRETMAIVAAASASQVAPPADNAPHLIDDPDGTAAASSAAAAAAVAVDHSSELERAHAETAASAAAPVLDLSVLVERKLLALDFQIASLALVLCHDYDMVAPRELIRAAICGASIGMVQRSFDTTYRLDVATIEVRDLYQRHGPMFKYIMNTRAARAPIEPSAAVVVVTPAAPPPPALAVTYQMVGLDCPVFESVFASTEATCTARLCEVQLYINPETIQQIMLFNTLAFPPPPAADDDAEPGAAQGPEIFLRTVSQASFASANSHASSALGSRLTSRALGSERGTTADAARVVAQNKRNAARRQRASEAAKAKYRHGGGKGGHAHSSNSLAVPGGAGALSDDDEFVDALEEQPLSPRGASPPAASLAVPATPTAGKGAAAAAAGAGAGAGAGAEPAPGFVCIALQATAVLTAVSITLNRGAEHVACVRLDGANIEYTQAAATLRARGTIGALSVTDLTPAAGLYRRIVSIRGDGNTLSFDYATHDRAAEGGDWDASVEAAMTSVYVVYLARFVAEMNAYSAVAVASMLDVSEAREALRAERVTTAELVEAAEAAERRARAGTGRSRQGSMAVAPAATAGPAEAEHVATATLRLSVKLTSPTIIVPRHSASRQVLVLDLGTITVANAITPYSEAVAVPYDSMAVRIEAMRMQLGTYQNLAGNRLVLQDVAMAVSVRRSLHWWETAQPGMVIAGDCAALALTLEQSDYALITVLTSDNFAEAVAIDKAAAAAAAAIAAKVAASAAADGQPVAAPAPAPAAPATAASGAAYTTMVVAPFRIGRLSLALSKGPAAVALLAMDGLLLDYRAASDATMKVRLALDSLAITDTSAGASAAYPHLLYYVESAGAAREPQVSVRYDTAVGGDSDVEVVLRRPRSVVLFPALYAVMDYFAPPKDAYTADVPLAGSAGAGAAADAAGSDAPAAPAAAGAATAAPAAAHAAPSTAVVVAAAPVAAAPPAAALPTMRATVSVIDPEFCLVETPTLAATRALVLQFGLSVKYVATAAAMTAEVALADFSIVKCVLSAKAATSLPLLAPTPIAVKYGARTVTETLTLAAARLRMAPPSDAAHEPAPAAVATRGAAAAPTAAVAVTETAVDLSLPALALRLSWQDYLLITAIQGTMPAAAPPPPADETAALKGLEFDAAAAVPPPLDADAADGAGVGAAGAAGAAAADATEDDTEIDPDESADPAAAGAAVAGPRGAAAAYVLGAPISVERLALRLPRLSLVLVNDMRLGQDTALLGLSLDALGVTVANWATDMDLQVEATLAAQYFSERTAVWEPVLEPWPFMVHQTSISRPAPASQIHVAAQTVLDLTVTHAFLETYYRLSYLMAEQSRAPAEAGAPRFYPYRLRNDSGLSMRYWLAPDAPRPLAYGATDGFSYRDLPLTDAAAAAAATASAASASTAAGVGTGAVVPANGASAPTSQDPADRAHFVSVELAGGYQPLRRIPIDAVGVYSYSLSRAGSHAAAGPADCLIVRVAAEDGAKVVTFESPVLVRNRTSVPIEVALDCSPPEGPRQTLRKLAVVAPGGSRAIPIALVRTARVVARPAATAGASFAWPPSASAVSWQQCHAVEPTKRQANAVAAASSAAAAAVVAGGSGASTLTAQRIGASLFPNVYSSQTAARKPATGADAAGHAAGGLASDLDASASLGVCIARSRDLFVDPLMALSLGAPFHTISLCAPLVLQNLLPTAVTVELQGVAAEVTTTVVLAEGEERPLYAVHADAEVRMRVLIGGFHWSQPLTAAPGLTEAEIQLHAASAPEPAADSGAGAGAAAAAASADPVMRLRVSGRDDAGGTGSRRHLSILAPYWIVNATGLPLLLAQEHGVADKHTPLAGLAGGPLPSGGPAVPASYPVKGLLAPKLSLAVPLPGGGATPFSSSFPIDAAGVPGTVSLPTGVDAGSVASSTAFATASTNAVTIGSRAASGTLPALQPPAAFATAADAPTAIASYELSVSVAAAAAPFSLVRIVTLSPRFMVVNQMTDTALEYMQTWTANAFVLEPGAAAPFHWATVKEKRRRRLMIRLRREGVAWCGEFSPEEPGVFKLKAVNALTGAVQLVPVEVRAVGAVLYITVSDSDGVPPMVLVNKTAEAMQYHQAGAAWAVADLAPGASAPYTWDEQARKKQLVLLLRGGAKRVSLNPMDLVSVTKFSLKAKGGLPAARLEVRVAPVGTARVVTVRDLASPEAAALADEDAVPEVPAFGVSLDLAGLGISLVDASPAEVAYVRLDRLALSYSTSNLFERLDLQLGSLQIDNTLRFTSLPVVLGPNIAKLGENPTLSVVYARSLRHTTMDYYANATVGLQALDLKVELTWVMRLLDFVWSLPQAPVPAGEAAPPPVSVAAVTAGGALLAPAATNARMQYFESLLINAMQINVTFAAGFEADGAAAAESGGAADANSSWVAQAIRGLGFSLANIDDAPLRLNLLFLEHVFAPQDRITARITEHYTSQGIRESYKLAGSIELLGNPVGLFADLGTGVADFFMEPAKGLRVSPKAFGKGVLKGSGSLLKHSVHGVFNTAAKSTGAVSRGLGVLTMDDAYVDKMRAKGKRPEHVGQGLMMGAKAFGTSLFEGVTGIVYQPYKGAKEGGALGFAKGVGKGLAGLIFKPIAGAVALVSNTTEGIARTANYWDDRLGRARPPRLIMFTSVTVYDANAAAGWDVLEHAQGELTDTDHLICFAPLFNLKAHSMVVTNRHIVIAKRARHDVSAASCWPLGRVSSLRTEGDDTIALTLAEERVGGAVTRPARRVRLQFVDAEITGELFERMHDVWIRHVPDTGASSGTGSQRARAAASRSHSSGSSGIADSEGSLNH